MIGLFILWLKLKKNTEKCVRDHTDLVGETDDWLLSCFRLPRELLMDLCNNLEPVEPRASTTSSTLSFSRRIISESDRRQVRHFTVLFELCASESKAIISFMPQYISFPHMSNQQVDMNKKAFFFFFCCS